MQPRRLLSVIVCLGVLGLLVALVVRHPKDPAPAVPGTPVLPEAGAPAASKASPVDVPVSSAPQAAEKAPNPAADASAAETARPADATERSIQRIEAAVVTYEAASLPVIAPFLTDSNPELRTAAREGLLQMGLSEAVPLLREAAGKMKDPREAILLLDAADFLELPSVSSSAGKKRRPHPPSSTKPPGETPDRR